MKKIKIGTIDILKLIVIFLVLVLMITFVALYAKSSSRVQQLESENKTLTETNQSIQAELEETKNAVTRLEEAQKADQEAKADETARAAQEKTEADMKLVENPIDMVASTAGLIFTEDQVDRANLGQYFCSYEVPEDVIARITGKSYRENDNITLSDLRYLKMLHYNFEGQIQMGEMIVNAEIVDDVLEIFQELFENQYQIYSMQLIDDYWKGDGESSDMNSIDHNNTSAFCYRTATASSKLSNHAYGRAIDLNPQQNPYVTYSSGEASWSHSNADAYIDRTSGADHVITHEDLAFQLFTEHGFDWGGDWTNPKDYQHFEKTS